MPTIAGLIEKAEKALEQVDVLIEDGKTEEARELVAKATSYREQAEVLRQAQTEKDAAQEASQKATRLPFDTAEDKQEEDSTEDVNTVKSQFYVLKYGDVESAKMAILKDMYGDYYALRDLQRNSMIKYVLGRPLTAAETKSLKQIVLLPHQLDEAIVRGESVTGIKATLQESINELGGYNVPEDWRAEVIMRLAAATIVRGRARQVSTIRDAVEWPKLEGGSSTHRSAVRITWVDEVPADANVALTNPTFGLLRVPVHTAMARTDVSQNLLEDSGVDILGLLAELFAEEMAFDEDMRFLTGTGGGLPRGILGKRSGANEVPEDGITVVNSGNASAVTADGLIDLAYNLDAQYRQNAVFMGAKLTHRDIRKLKDGNGDYLWAKGIAPGEPPTLLGYPFLESESMPAIAANNHPIVFGDLRGYLIVDRVGMSIQRIEDTTTAGQNKVAIFARRRLGGQVIEPWRFQAQKVSA